MFFTSKAWFKRPQKSKKSMKSLTKITKNQDLNHSESPCFSNPTVSLFAASNWGFTRRDSRAASGAFGGGVIGGISCPHLESATVFHCRHRNWRSGRKNIRLTWLFFCASHQIIDPYTITCEVARVMLQQERTLNIFIMIRATGPAFS